MPTDVETLMRYHNVEFTEDASLVIEPKLKPSYPTRHVADHDDCIRWGRSLGPDRQSLLVVGSN
jgi:hypothetical protein